MYACLISDLITPFLIFNKESRTCVVIENVIKKYAVRPKVTGNVHLLNLVGTKLKS
jgi:hypothetical protein